MTDREYLELAAKAAGIEIWWTYNYGGVFLRQRGRPVVWDPLNSDADALQLAVKLEIQLDLRHSMNTVWAYGAPQGMLEEGAKDPHAATRRAIVRAAAEIGKEMK